MRDLSENIIKAIGIFGLIFGIISLISGCLSLGGAEFTMLYYTYHSMKNTAYFIKIHGPISAFSIFFSYFTYRAFLWSIIGLTITSMISDVLMLYGILKKKPPFIIVWLVITINILVVSKTLT